MMKASRMSQDDDAWKAVARYSSMAFILPAATFAGYFIGYLLDKALHTHFLYLVFMGLGVVGGFLELFRELKPDDAK